MNVIAHRGASVARPENTPGAFVRADEMRADGVELDVRIAADGRGGNRLVVFHDPLPGSQTEIDALHGFDEVLDACGDRMLVNVEIKNSDDGGGHDPSMAVVAPTIAAMRRRGPSWDQRWLVSSFDLDTINECRRAAPGIPTAFLVSDVTESAVEAAVSGGHVAIHPWAGALTADAVAACHAAGLRVHTWTCNDPERLRRLWEMGVDGVCTDVPDIARAALGRENEPADLTPSWGTRA